VVALARDERWRRWEVPGHPQAVQAFGDALRARGMTVAPEVGLGTLAGFLAGVMVAKVLAVVAAGLVLGAIANVVLALTGKGGSLLLGFALLGGALACMVVVALFRTAAQGAQTPR